MKRKLLSLLLCLFLCLFLAGCGSTEPEETVDETPVVEAVPETPASAPAPAPAPAPVVDDSAARAEATAKAEAAKKEAAAKAVADARDAAINAGAADLLPDELALIDEGVEAAMKDEAGDYEANSKKAAAYYNALEKAAKGYALYNELVEDEYNVFAPEAFAAADAAIDEVIDLWYADADISEISAKIDEAYALLEKTKEEGYDEAILRKAEQLDRQVTYFRNQVLESNAATDYAGYLAIIDAQADAARAQYEKDGDYEAVKAAADNVIAGYKALVEAALAEEAYWKVYDNDLEDRDPASFERGWAAVEVVLALDEAGSQDWNAFLEQATIAYESFQKIVDDAYKNDANAQRDRYGDAKKKADAIKANVAAKTDYAAATKLLLDGDASASRGQWEKAYFKYRKAADAMMDVFETVSVKRNAAQEAMDRAKQKAAEVAELAAQADEIAPLADEEAAE